MDDANSAIVAENGGANRIELCSALELGGLTPSIGLLLEVKKHVKIPVFCMIRCRSGDFFYNSCEISTMVSDAKLLSENGADGFVFGFLNGDQNVDIKSCNVFFQSLPRKLPCTFHRAFDFISNQTNALQMLKDVGFSRILTTGGGPDVSSSLNELKSLYTQSQKVAITLMPGGGVNEANITVLRSIGFVEIHSSCSVYTSDGAYGTLFNNPLPNGKRKIVCRQKVENLISKLNQL